MKIGLKYLALTCLILNLANCGIKPKNLEPRDASKNIEHPRSYPSR